MALTPFDNNMAIISMLDDEPNDVGGLSAEDLKREFDRSGKEIQEFLNDTLIPEVDEALGDTLDAAKLYTNEKVVEIGSADMAKAVYDPRHIEQDIFEYALPMEQRGAPGGVATLGSDGKVPPSQMPAIYYEKITEHNFSGNVQQVDINLGVDIWNYSRIFVTVSITAATNDFNAGEVLLNGMTGVYGQPRVNGTSTNPSEQLVIIGFGGASTQSAISTITLHVMRDSPVSKRVILATREVAVHSHTGYHTYQKEASTGIYETDSTAPINKINFRAYNGPLMSGGRVEVYGVKK